MHTSVGFTLIEMLVYMSLLIIISGVGVLMLISLSDSFQHQKLDQLLLRNGSVVLERMLSDIRNAQDVDAFYSTFVSTPGVLTLLSGTSTTAYTVSGGTLFLSVDGVQTQVTDNTISVEELRFYSYDNLETEMVRVQLQLSATRGSSTRTRIFNAGAVLRGSYE